MDKLRALEYFVAAAEAHSLSGAARQLNVSVPAVAKLVTGLERRLGARLFERTAHGLALTANGESYLEACRPLLAELAEADEVIGASSNRARGTVVVGVQHVLAYHCLVPALPRFHALYPDIRIDVHDFNRVAEEEMRGVDVFLVLGWPRVGDLVHRQIGSARFVVCAAPDYWATHGVPQRPRDLAQHNCLLTRNVDGIVMDLWSFRRGEEQEAVTVTGWLVTSNPHRDGAMEIVLAGGAVARGIDLANRARFQTGALVPALTDWEAMEAPPVNLMYRPSCRRIPRVRLFIDFVTALFRELERERERRIVPTGRPAWLRQRSGLASAVTLRGRGRPGA